MAEISIPCGNAFDVNESIMVILERISAVEPDQFVCLTLSDKDEVEDWHGDPIFIRAADIRTVA